MIKKIESLSVAALQDIVYHTHFSMYGTPDGGYDSDKEWDSETLDEIANTLGLHGLYPEATRRARFVVAGRTGDKPRFVAVVLTVTETEDPHDQRDRAVSATGLPSGSPVWDEATGPKWLFDNVFDESEELNADPDRHQEDGSTQPQSQ